MNWLRFINKIKPDGKAFSSVKFALPKINYTLILFEVMADAFQMLIDYATVEINDQVWFVNDNFNPAPWEARYGITPPITATLEERRIVVKSYMLYPQSANRLSLDYMQSVIDEKGFTGITVEYNSLGNDEGFLRANDFGDEKLSFNLGALTYNSFIVSGTVTAAYYYEVIYTLLGLKPLQVALYDKISIDQVMAYDDTLSIAIDDNFTLVMPIL